MACLLFTDIEGSSGLWERHPQGMRTSIEHHHEAVQGSVAEHRGRVVKDTGDGFFAVFDTPQDALGAALDAQKRLSFVDWQDTGPLLVRMGLHVGPVEVDSDGDLRGVVVNRAARVMDAGHGAQIVASDDFIALAEPVEGCWFESLGVHRLKGLSGSAELFQVCGQGLRHEFPALRTLDGLPNNLPYAVSGFVGRSEETRQLVDLLLASRLVTVIGPGGAGKTRLCLNVGTEALWS